MSEHSPHGRMSVRYTHGHGPAVLEGHSRRGALDSAGYLLPRLHPGQAQPFGGAVDLTAKFGVGGGCTEEFEGDLVGNLSDSIVNQVAQRGFGQVNVYGDAG